VLHGGYPLFSAAYGKLAENTGVFLSRRIGLFVFTENFSKFRTFPRTRESAIFVRGGERGGEIDRQFPPADGVCNFYPRGNAEEGTSFLPAPRK